MQACCRRVKVGAREAVPLPDELRADAVPGRSTDATFLGRMSLAALGGPALLEALAACSSEHARACRRARAPRPRRPEDRQSPSTPVTWPVDKAALIADGLSRRRAPPSSCTTTPTTSGPGVVKAFEKKYAAYDVKVRVSTFNDTDEALTKIRAGKSGFDIYFPSYDQIAKMVTAKLIRPLNHSYIPNIANVWPEFTNPWYDGEWHYTVPYTRLHDRHRLAGRQGHRRHRRDAEPLRRVLGHRASPASSP